MKKILTQTAVLLAAVFFIALSAQMTIEIPLDGVEIPISGQSFAVLLVAGLLAGRKGTLAVVLYVLLGALGLPIFADGASGLAVLMGGSGGFLIGFIAAAAMVEFCILKLPFQAQTLLKYTALMTLGTTIILLFGIGRLTTLYGFEKAMQYGFYPFWQGAIIKIILGAVVLYLVKSRERILSSKENKE